MPKKNNKVYTQEEFENDINELEEMINKQKGGENEENNYNYENDVDSQEGNNQFGGKKAYTGTYRHFKIVEVNGKPVNMDAMANIKEHQTPISAAKKLLRSYCRAKGLKESDRLKLHITFTIRETTRGHSKFYGPYSGKYRKYTAQEMKASVASGITFHMKPEVRLHKEKVQKGG